MRYERETRTFEEWEQERDGLREDFRVAATLMVKTQDSEVIPDYQKKTAVDEWEKTVIRFAKRLDRAEYHCQNGVVTRRGNHIRYEKLRFGHLISDTGEHTTTWCVLEIGPDIIDLRALEKKHAHDVGVEYGVKPEDMDADELEQVVREAKEEVRDRVYQQVVNACKKRFGWEPYTRHVYADYSPTGRWFSNVYFEQRGNRVLVEQCNAIDI
jgi:hypothetical protein